MDTSTPTWLRELNRSDTETRNLLVYREGYLEPGIFLPKVTFTRSVIRNPSSVIRNRAFRISHHPLRLGLASLDLAQGWKNVASHIPVRPRS